MRNNINLFKFFFITLPTIVCFIVLFVVVCLKKDIILDFYGGVENVGLPFDIQDQGNKALLFTMTDEPGRTRNIEIMKKTFEDGSLGFKCESYHNKPLAEIYKTIKQTVSEMDDQDTLLLYLNSHGGGSGKNFAMTASGGGFKFSKVLETIASVKKIKRLIVLVDTCHAEGAINEGFQGGAKLIKNSKTAMFELPDYYGGSIKPSFMKFFEKDGNNFYYGKDSNAYEEMLILTSSSAKDLSIRGVFATNFKNTFDNAKTKKDLTVAEFLKMFALNHSKNGQQPYYKAKPESILNEPLFRNLMGRLIPIKDKSGEKKEFKQDYILTP